MRERLERRERFIKVGGRIVFLSFAAFLAIEARRSGLSNDPLV